MKKIALIYGTISGLLMVLMFVISFYLMDQGILKEHSELLGYATMIIVLSLIFFGIKSFRDKHNSGAITFWKGFTVGLAIASIASFFYATGWEVYYNGVPGVKENFMNKYTDSLIAKMKQEGAAQEKIDAKIKEMESMKEMYKNPFMRYGMTLAEIFPVGLVIALISAGILRKKESLPAS
jgi:zinc transporter ZupT